MKYIFKFLSLITVILFSSAITFASEASDSNYTNNSPEEPEQSTTQLDVKTSFPLEVVSSVARPSMGGQNSAAYIILKNNTATDVKITSASSKSTANNVELHIVTDTNGVKSMVAVNEINVPANSTLEMKKGDIHIMLLDLKKALNVGDIFPISLTVRTVDSANNLLEFTSDIQVEVVQM